MLISNEALELIIIAQWNHRSTFVSTDEKSVVTLAPTLFSLINKVEKKSLWGYKNIVSVISLDTKVFLTYCRLITRCSETHRRDIWTRYVYVSFIRIGHKVVAKQEHIKGLPHIAFLLSILLWSRITIQTRKMHFPNGVKHIGFTSEWPSQLWSN